MAALAYYQRCMWLCLWLCCFQLMEPRSSKVNLSFPSRLWLVAQISHLGLMRLQVFEVGKERATTATHKKVIKTLEALTWDDSLELELPRGGGQELHVRGPLLLVLHRFVNWLLCCPPACAARFWIRLWPEHITV